ncbi:MAG: glycosyltransferase family 4 protein [Myxococcota bacterium]|nr:glycosyltransferase family 4 protein [Myxococcota bacterium]
MDILIVSQFFTPEMGAPAARFHDFGRLLVDRGHRVTVLTGFPNSPSGVVPDAYRGKLRMRETIEGIEILRGWLYASPRLSKATKSAGFGSYAASASLWALLGRPPADVVIATSPPPTVGIPGLLASKVLGAPLVFDVRDIWPEAIANAGRLKSGALIRTLEGIAHALYRSAAAVSVVTEGKRARLIETGVPEEKIAVIPNGVDLSRFDAVDATPARSLLRDHGVDVDRFVVLYAGVFNPPQGLDILLDAAALLRSDAERAGRIQFVLVGDGSRRPHLETRVANEELGDLVKLLPIQPREMIPPLLSTADAVAVTLRPRNDTHTVPSKIYEAMASGNPVLLSADGAPAEIVAESGAGLASPAADVEALVASIARLLDDPGATRAMGARGRRFATASDRRILVERLEKLLVRVVDGARGRR